ncbi:MAG: DUF3775 domain-containing protein [Rubellimicrobium sp.]|nr:DUF3775 domain-containing protein [Rubellimicrobium sp.]
MPALEISPVKVGQIIILARDPGRVEAELDEFIAAMNEDEQAELVALMWIGRGAFEADDWDEALATARGQATTPTADYLKGSPHLADHLEAGLDALGIDPEEAEDAVY